MGINVSTQFYENVYSDVFAAATEVLQSYVTENRQALKGKQAVNLVTGSGGVLDCGSGALKITTSAQLTAETMLSVPTESSIKLANEIISKSLNNVEQIRPAHLEPLEAMAFKGARWWSLDELLGSDVATLPVNLRDHLGRLVDGDLPDEPLDIGTDVPY